MFERHVERFYGVVMVCMAKQGYFNEKLQGLKPLKAVKLLSERTVFGHLWAEPRNCIELALEHILWIVSQISSNVSDYSIDGNFNSLSRAFCF